MAFQFYQLPVELTLEIARLAASPPLNPESDSASMYATARALALASFDLRKAAMPHLLHTVVLNSQDSLNKFLQTLCLQKRLAAHRSRLRLDYPHLVRRMWTSRCWEPILTSAHTHALLEEILCNAHALGFTFVSYHLLYDTLGAIVYDPEQWSCRRLTFAGDNLRWNPLTSTANGIAFLRRLTHLTIWLPEDDTIGPTYVSHLDPDYRVPNWVKKIPFEYMSDLTHFAFTLVGTPRAPTTAIVVYVLTPNLLLQHDATVFRAWATSGDPVAYGKIVDIDLTHSPGVRGLNWGMAFLKGENDVWPTCNTD